MAFPAFLDTCAIYGGYVCDTMLTLADAGTYRPLWSDDVLRELERNLIENAGLDERQVRHRIDEMRRSFPDAEVHGYANLIAAMTCDTKDRHVLAAAVRANAEIIVTFNLRDFPQSSLDPYDIEAVHPDAFLLDQLDLHRSRVIDGLHEQAARYQKSPMATSELLGALARSGLPDFAEAVRSELQN